MLGWIFFGVQALLAARVVARIARTARGTTIGPATAPGEAGCTCVLVPVLDEESRLGACLDGLRASDGAVREILVVDGGSRDATPAIVLAAAKRDARIRLVAAPPVPAGWNGKAWNLETGLRASDPSCRYVAMIDADVRPAPGLFAALAAHAGRTGLEAFSVATRQRLSGPADALLHPAMLATLVYRFGIPGSATDRVARVQANGQCFFARRELLVQSDAIALARDSRSEDATMARALAARGTRVGFFEAGGFATVTMYADWREMLRGWPRSLPMLDRYSRAGAWIGLLEVALVQALPPWIAAALVLAGAASPSARALLDLQTILIVMRLATLAGMRRAYDAPAPTYWFSFILDLPVAALLVASALRRRHTWRGRVLVAEGSR